jgi:hypothetical protein
MRAKKVKVTEERAGRGPEEEREQAAPVAEGERAQFRGEREDEREVVAGEEAGHARLALQRASRSASHFGQCRLRQEL